MQYTALLLIDLQRDFLHTNGRLPVGEKQAENVVDCALRLISGAAIYGFSPIFIVNHFSASDRLRNLFRRHSAIAGSEGAKIDSRITSKGFPIIVKETSDAFSNPELNLFLTSQKIINLAIVGVYAEGCILATAKGALKRGYKVTIVSDGVESNKKWKKRLAFWYMRRRGAHFVSSRDLLTRAE